MKNPLIPHINRPSALSDFQRRAGLQHAGEQILELDTALIDCRAQIRGADNPGFAEVSIDELADSMARDGQHEPAVVRPHPDQPGRFLMVAGERRYRACLARNMPLKAVVRELTDDQALRVQRAENVQREALTNIEIASVLRADKTRLGTLEAVAAEWNKSIRWVADRLQYLGILEQDGPAAGAVLDGLTADISAVVELGRLEKQDPAAAAAVVETVRQDPVINVRQAVRQAWSKVENKPLVASNKSAARKERAELAESFRDVARTLFDFGQLALRYDLDAATRQGVAKSLSRIRRELTSTQQVWPTLDP